MTNMPASQKDSDEREKKYINGTVTPRKCMSYIVKLT